MTFMLWLKQWTFIGLNGRIAQFLLFCYIYTITVVDVSNNKVLLCVLKQFLRARLQTAHESCFNQELRQKMLLKGREAKKSVVDT